MLRAYLHCRGFFTGKALAGKPGRGVSVGNIVGDPSPKAAQDDRFSAFSFYPTESFSAASATPPQVARRAADQFGKTAWAPW